MIATRLFAGALVLVAIGAQGDGDTRLNYLLHCGGCHLPNGAGSPPNVPSLIDEPGRIAGVQGGRDFLVRVPGATQSQMTNAELAAVMNWILDEFNARTLPKDFERYSEADARDGRAGALADPLKRRAEIWQGY